jgi:hypothetical protein
MNQQYAVLFSAIDDYIKVEHNCFVSECFLNSSRTEWVICARPTNKNPRPLDIYACKYFRLTLEEVEELCASNGLSSARKSKIDNDLNAITGRHAPPAPQY